MPTLHRGCGGALVWQSVVDDDGQPVMVPWCRGCGQAVEDGRIEGRLDGIAVDVGALAEHGRLLRMAAGWPSRVAMRRQ